MVNQVYLIGNIVKDFEVRETPGGTMVSNIEMIVDSPLGKKTFINLTAWEDLAEKMSSYLKKGSKVFINGRLTTDVFTDRNTGQSVNRLIVTVISFVDLSKTTFPNENIND